MLLLSLHKCDRRLALLRTSGLFSLNFHLIHSHSLEKSICNVLLMWNNKSEQIKAAGRSSVLLWNILQCAAHERKMKNRLDSFHQTEKGTQTQHAYLNALILSVNSNLKGSWSRFNVSSRLWMNESSKYQLPFRDLWLERLHRRFAAFLLFYLNFHFLKWWRHRVINTVWKSLRLLIYFAFYSQPSDVSCLKLLWEMCVFVL